MPTILSSDIDEQILAALSVVFTTTLQTNVVGDPLALKTLKQFDLQDDPTQVAPYLVFGPAKNEDGNIRQPSSEEERMFGWCPAEIGGPLRYVHLFEGKFGTPVSPSREAARALAASLLSRIAGTIIMYQDLSGVLSSGELASADESRVIRGSNPLLVTQMGYRIYAGEQTFYGEGKLSWRYPVEWYIQTHAFGG